MWFRLLVADTEWLHVFIMANATEGVIERVLDKLLGRVHPYILTLLAYTTIGLGAMWALPWAIDQFALIGEKFAGVTLTARSLLDMALAFASIALMALIFGVAVRITGWGLYRREIREIGADISAIKERLDMVDQEQESEAGDG